MRYFTLRISLMVLLVIYGHNWSFSQYSNIWAFGINAGIDFNTDPPVAITTRINTSEGTASVCNANGQLLFYTDGTTVWDRNHNIMDNGSDLHGLGTDITSSTTQGTLIVPIPGDTRRYYIFSLGSFESGFLGRLYYSEVDMNLNNGIGSVSRKGNLLDSSLTEHMTAVSGNNCNVWLLMASRSNVFKAYSIDINGIAPPVISPRIPGGGGGSWNGVLGSLDVSPDRNKAAIAQGLNVALYDFNTDRGTLTNPLMLYENADSYYYGICFSPDNSKLYAANEAELHQFDLRSRDTAAIKASRQVIAAVSYPGLKRGPDGKIYCAHSGSGSLDVINKPNLAGTACQFVVNGFPLLGGTRSTRGLPNSTILVALEKNTTTLTDTIRCADSFTLAATDTARKNYLWQDGSLEKTLTIDTSGTYWVTYQNVTGNICEEYIDTFHIVFYKNKRIYSTNFMEGMCRADTLILQAQHMATGGYLWEDASPGNTKVARKAGTHWVNYRVDSLCELYTDTFRVSYHEYQLSFTTDTLHCVDDPVVLHNTSDEPFTDFRWTYGNGAGSSNKHPVAHSYTHPGRYELKLVGLIEGRCADSAMSYITVDALFPLRLEADRKAICAGENVHFYTQIDSTTIQALYWLFDDQERMTTANGLYYQHAYASPGTFVVQLKALSRACPDVERTDTIKVYPLPRIDLGPDSSLCWQGQTILLANKALQTGGDYTYLWSTGATGTLLPVTQPGSYSLTISAAPLGCSSTETVTVAKDCYVDIPNAFTPDGDGHNDYFFPRQLLSAKVTAFNMQIRNRWGQLLFETNATDGRGWDGRYNNQEQPAGVYVYQVLVSLGNNTRQQYQGNVTLLR